jgi:hypothetical protein
MTLYKCYFNFNDILVDGIFLSGDIVKTIVLSVLSDQGIVDFQYGFWINDKLKLTKGSDCKFWIAPSQILLIEKITDA